MRKDPTFTPVHKYIIKQEHFHCLEVTSYNSTVHITKGLQNKGKAAFQQF